MYKNIDDVTLESLKNNCQKIHYFGLGFIQIKLTPEYRIHFYNKKLPAIIGDEDVHNHRYDFNSKIFAGSFHQEVFQLTDGDTHILEQESCKEGESSQSVAKVCGIKQIMTQDFTVGSEYSVDADMFHRVAADFAITFLKRGEVKKEFADVVREKTALKVCPFSKKIPENELWDMVDEMLKQAKGNK